MTAAIYIIQGILIVVCLLMVFIVLMQRPKQEGLGASFGAGVTDQIWGAQTTNVLQKFTVRLAILFFGLSLALCILKAKDSKAKSGANILANLPTEKVEPKPAPAPTPPNMTTTPIEVKPGENNAPAISITPAPAAEGTTPAPAPTPAPEGATPASAETAPATTPAPAATETPSAEPKKEIGPEAPKAPEPVAPVPTPAEAPK